MKNKISRRDFVKLTLLSFGTTFLAACERAITPVATLISTLTPIETNTNTPEPTKADTPQPTATETSTPTPTEIPCFQLNTPENGMNLEEIGKVTFSWEAMPGAESYNLEIILPSKKSVFFETKDTNRDLYIEVLQMGGIFQWKVTALDTNEKVICITEPFTFEKPAYTPNPSNGNSGNGGSGGDGGCFLAGTTIIMTDGSLVNIENIQTGNQIKSFDLEKKEITVSEVQETKNFTRENYYLVKLNNGTILEVTGDHPLYTKKQFYEGWASLEPVQTQIKYGMVVKQLDAGDFLFDYKDSFIEIDDVELVESETQVYTITVGSTHTFFADGVLVHNKGDDDDDIGSG